MFGFFCLSCRKSIFILVFCRSPLLPKSPVSSSSPWNGNSSTRGPRRGSFEGGLLLTAWSPWFIFFYEKLTLCYRHQCTLSTVPTFKENLQADFQTNFLIVLNLGHPSTLKNSENPVYACDWVNTILKGQKQFFYLAFPWVNENLQVTLGRW